MITKNQFDLLVYLSECIKKPTQREIANNLKKSLGTINKLISELESLGFVSNGMINENGIGILENYKVKRAVFIVAGFGSRLVPITLNTPKPLVRVKGKRIIDTLLDAVIALGIEEIYLIIGYLGEQFDQLLYKYPMIKFIENPVYNEANNISSLYCARYLLKNAYILEGDLLLYNPALIKKYQDCSNYLGVPVEKTNDWCFYTDGDKISKVSIGGVNCYHMFGISYWDENDGIKLSTDIEKVYFSPGGKERYWDMVPLEYCKENSSIGVRECSFDDITEIDTFNELKALDKTYDI